MPRGDRTGPMGQGPMTGRRAGFCSGYDMPGFANPVPGGFAGRGGRGGGQDYGRGYAGGGRGWRNRFYATGIPGRAAAGYPVSRTPTMSRDEELAFLKSQADDLSTAMEDIRRRINELETDG